MPLDVNATGGDRSSLTAVWLGGMNFSIFVRRSCGAVQ